MLPLELVKVSISNLVCSRLIPLSTSAPNDRLPGMCVYSRSCDLLKFSEITYNISETRCKVET